MKKRLFDSKLLLILFIIIVLLSISSCSLAASTLSQVKGLRGVINGETITLYWKKDKAADKYIVYYTTDQSREPVTKEVTATSFDEQFTDLEGLDNGTYTIKVYSMDNNGRRGPDSDSIKLTMKTGHNAAPGGVGQLQATPSDSNVKLTWRAAPDATKYKVVLTYPDGTTKTSTTSTTTKYFSYLSSGEYSATVTAIKVVDGKPLESENPATVSFTIDAASSHILDRVVINNDYTTNYQTLNFSWSEVEGATGYIIQRIKPDNTIVTYGNDDNPIKTTYANLTNLDSGKNQIMVRAVYKGETGTITHGMWSRPIRVTIYASEDEIPKIDVSGINFTSNGSSFTFNWSPIKIADGYIVKYHIPGTGTFTYGDDKDSLITDNRFTINNVTETKLYHTISIASYVTVGNTRYLSDFSDPFPFNYLSSNPGSGDNPEVTEIGPVNNFAVRTNALWVTWTWDPVPGATSYIIEWIDPGIVEPITISPITDTICRQKASQEGLVVAKVKAVGTINGEEKEGPWSDLLTSSASFEAKLPTITDLKANVNGNHVDFSWSAITDPHVDGYEISWKETKKLNENDSMATTVVVEKDTTTNSYSADFDTEGTYSAQVRAFRYDDILGNKVKEFANYSPSVPFTIGEGSGEGEFDAVQNVTATVNGEWITIQWDNLNIDGLKGYDIKWTFPNVKEDIKDNGPHIGYINKLPVMSSGSVAVCGYKEVDGKKVRGKWSAEASFTVDDSNNGDKPITNEKIRIKECKLDSSNKLTVQWSSLNNVAGYKIILHKAKPLANEKEYYTLPVPASATIYTKQINLSGEYSVRVAGVRKIDGEAKEVGLSDAINIQGPSNNNAIGPVQHVTADVGSSGDSIKIEWHSLPVDGIEGYEIKWHFPNTDDIIDDVGDTKLVTVKLPIMSSGSVAVRGYKVVNGKKAPGEWSAEVPFEVDDSNVGSKITITKCDFNSSSSKLDLKWTSLNNVLGYTVILHKENPKANEKEYTNIPVKGTSFSKVLKLTGKYSVRVAGVRNNNDTDPIFGISDAKYIQGSSDSNAIGPVQHVTADVGTSNGAATIKIEWRALLVDGIEGYEVKFHFPNTDDIIKDVKLHYLLDTKLPVMSSGSVAVRGYKIVNGEKVPGEWSAEVPFEVDDSNIGSKITITKCDFDSSSSKLDLKWTSLNNVLGYTIILHKENPKANEKEYTNIPVKGTSFSKVLKLTGKYSVRVAGVRNNNDADPIFGTSDAKYIQGSSDSNAIGPVQHVTADVGTSNGAATIKIEWRALPVDGIEGYEIKWHFPNTDDIIEDVKLHYLLDTKLPVMSSGSVAVRGYKIINGEKVPGEWSTEVPFEVDA